MDKIEQFLEGKKTYIGIAISVIGVVLKGLDIVDTQTGDTIIAFGGGFALYGLRKAVEKSKFGNI